MNMCKVAEFYCFIALFVDNTVSTYVYDRGISVTIYLHVNPINTPGAQLVTLPYVP